MAPSQSNLQNPKYGYDIVVSTTQESINTGLIQYLQNTSGKHPINYMFFLADDKGDPTRQKSYDDFMELSGNINPFDIPHGTDYKDERITKLTAARMVCAIRMRTGIPPGMIQIVEGKGPQLVLPEPIVTLGSSADNVLFNMYCSDIVVVRNSPPSGWGSPGTWEWFSQSPGKPWYIKTRTSLLVADLDKNLNTPYFDAHPEEREALKARLNNLSSTAYSLQQLLFNLDSAIMQTLPDFVGITDATAKHLLGLTFNALWAKTAKEQGLPLVGVNVVPQHKDESPLQMTALERHVSPVVDARTGERIPNPDAEQLAATTLNYLCATGGNALPGSSSFTWNWIEPKDVAQSSGVMAIKRSALARFLVDQILPQARASCIEPWSKVTALDIVGGLRYSWKFTPGQEPTIEHTKSGPAVASLSYRKEVRSSDKMAATYGELNITSSYNCCIVLGDFDFLTSPPKPVGGRKFTVVQHLLIHAYCQWALTPSRANMVDVTFTDEYIISVTSQGQLITSKTNNSSKVDRSQSGDASAIADFFTGVNAMIDAIKKASGNFLAAKIRPIPFEEMKNFVFPGAKVFSYKDAAFSNYQDLTGLITYVNPTSVRAKHIPDTHESRILTSKVLNLPELPSIALYVDDLFAAGLLGPTFRDVNGSDFADTSGKRARNSNLPVPPGVESVEFRYPIGGTTRGYRPGIIDTNSLSDGDSRLTASTELMLNYTQGKLVEPQGKFKALQMSDGTALLFAVNSNGVLNVVREAVGENQTGWVVEDLSSDIIKREVGNSGVVRAFDVAQSVMGDNTIGLGMAVRVADTDILFLSLLNSPHSGSGWTRAPKWTSFHFDDLTRPRSLQITDIYFSETEHKQQYIMVDILRDPGSELKLVDRYIVNPFSKTGLYWKAHALPFDVEEGTYQSCMGRCSGALVDGIYTAGTVQGRAQLAYVPLFNITGSAAPMPTLFQLPSDEPASAVTSARNASHSSGQYGTTDFFAIAGSTLYRWDPDEQMEPNATGKHVLTNRVFAGTDTLIATMHDRVTTLFGKNASNQVWYVSCPSDRVAAPGSWSVPVPLLEGIERITSFVNLKDGGNTVFAAGKNNIHRLVQATHTASKTWQSQAIMVAAEKTSKAMAFRSYTTTIKVIGGDGAPKPSAKVTLTAKYRTPVHIDGLYYVLSAAEITVTSDSSGQVTVIQATESLVGSVITARIGAAAQDINPMQKSFQKLSALSNPTSLRQARIVDGTTAGGVLGDPKSKPLVATSVSDADVRAVADAIGMLKEAYMTQASSQVARTRSSPRGVITVSSATATYDLLDDFAMAAGDLFNWLKTGIRNIFDVVWDGVTGVWRFIVKIAGQVYHAALDTIEAVVGALEWVFEKVKTAVEDVIRYVEFLFEWNDIRRTKNIMHSLIKYHLQDTASRIAAMGQRFEETATEAQKAVGRWSGVQDWSALGDAASKPPGADVADPSKDQTPGSQLLSSHFRSQAEHLELPGGSPAVDLVQDLVDELIDAIADAGEVWDRTLEELKKLAAEFGALSVADVLKRLAGILTSAVLGATRVAVVALFNALAHIADAVIAILDTKIHIPVISDILNAIGVDDVSLLDLITWIAAAGVTVVHKIIKGRPPFPDDATSRALERASDWKSFSAAARGVTGPKTATAANGYVNGSSPVGPSTTGYGASLIYIAGHSTAGFVAFVGNFLYFAEAMDPSPANVFGLPSAVMGIIGAAAAGGADYLAGKLPIANTGMSAFSAATTGVTLVSKVVFSGVGQKYLATGKLAFLKADDNRKVGAVINSILVVPALICTGWHFYELASEPESRDRSCAIIGETSKMVSYVGRLAYTAALFDPDPATRIVPAGILAATNVAMFGLETAAVVTSL